MSRISRLKDYVKTNKGDLGLFASEVYSGVTAGLTDFATLDGGAHKGWHTFRLLQMPGCAIVYAVEADPAMAANLRQVMAKRRPADGAELIIVEKALQDRSDITDIAWMSCHTHVGRSSIEVEGGDLASIWSGHRDMEYLPTVRVEATTIDAILADEPRRIPFIKLDLEGADFIALRGAENTLRNRRPVVTFENSSKAPAVHGYTLADAMAYFDRLGYRAIDCVGEVMTAETWFDFHDAWVAPIEKVDLVQPLIAAAAERRLGPA